ncbi:hypothetical protein Pelo_5767 [Pelomyxa schiedti]|nr:hypothetical protein Pelo_5767 [Pelomyxa schiedti]
MIAIKYPWVIFQGNSVPAIPALDASFSKVCFKSLNTILSFLPHFQSPDSLDQSIGSDGVVFDEHSVVHSHELQTFSPDLVVVTGLSLTFPIKVDNQVPNLLPNACVPALASKLYVKELPFLHGYVGYKFWQNLCRYQSFHSRLVEEWSMRCL